MGFFIDNRFSLRSTRTTRLQLCYELRFLVGTEIVSEELGWLEFFADDPKAGLGSIEKVLVLIFFLKQDSDGLPFAESVISGVGHHYETFENVHRMLH